MSSEFDRLHERLRDEMREMELRIRTCMITNVGIAVVVLLGCMLGLTALVIGTR